MIDPLVKSRRDFSWDFIYKYVTEMKEIYKTQIGIILDIEYIHATMEVCIKFYFLGTLPIHKI